MMRSASLPIGQYRLNMPVEDLHGLTEFSDPEYVIYGRTFEGEKNYNAPAIEFVTQHWKVALGAVWGKIYKVGYFFESERRDTARIVSADVMRFCQERLGVPSEDRETMFAWDAPDGNVVLQFGKVGTTYLVNLFETSRSVRTFVPRRSTDTSH